MKEYIKENKPTTTPEACNIAGASDDDKAEAQSMYHLYCDKCGHTWWSPSWDNYCPRWGCTGHARKM